MGALPALEKAFLADPVSGDIGIAKVDGEIPGYIRGVLYRNGPGRFARGGLAYRHWLDGDGMISALSFTDEGPRFKSAFVKNHKFKEEEEAARPLYRMFGTGFDGDRLNRYRSLVSGVNVSIFRAGGSLLAFGEQGLPWLIDPQTLETLGEFDFDGQLDPTRPCGAHPRFDPASGEMLFFGVDYRPRSPALVIYRFDRELRLQVDNRIPLDSPRYIHDCAISANYMIFHIGPCLLDADIMIAKGGTVLDSLRWDPEKGARLLVVDRRTGECSAEVPVAPRHALHWINAFETNGQLVLDLVEFDRPIYDQMEIKALYADIPHGRPVRYTIDVKRGECRETNEFPYVNGPDFPVIDNRKTGVPYGDFWALGISKTGQKGPKFYDELLRLDFDRPGAPDIYRAPEGRFMTGDPIFVAAPGETTGGSLIVQDMDIQTGVSGFSIFDAYSIAQGPSATITLKDPIPLGIHGFFEAS